MTAPLRAVPDAPAVTLTDAIEAWAAAHAHPEQAGTTRQYGSALRRLARDLGPGRDVASITRADLAAWMREHHAASKPATWNRARAAIRAAWAWWAGQGWCREPGGKAWPVEPRKKAAFRPRPLPGDVLAALLRDESVPVRERCLWRMLYDTGARLSEVLSLDAGRIDREGRRAAVVRKGGDGGEVTWGPKAAALLGELLGERAEGPVFLSAKGGALSARRAQELFAAATASLPGGPCNLHQFRHSQASWMAARGASTLMMQAKTDHHDPRMLAVYARVSTDALQAWEASQPVPEWDRDEEGSGQ